MRWSLSSSYLSLPPDFFTEMPPTPVGNPRPAVFNQTLADELGLGTPDAADIAYLSGNASVPGSRPFAQAYAGHQFGGFSVLGDGRALVLGEHRTPEGRLVDLQLKGSGPTPYSRSGDGRAALGPMLREFLIGEALHAFGLPTTRALAVVETGETVRRDTPRPGAVLTRVAASHLRVGTFEYAAALGDRAALEALTAYALGRHYPDAAGDTPAEALLSAVAEAQASLLAGWMAFGFVHGVMNTDNMALSGESIDFGPCAFLDTYREDQVFSSIDRQGRYAYGRQPLLARWNLTRFAEALLPLIDADPEKAVARAQPVINGFLPRYRHHWSVRMAAKLGLRATETAGPLADDLLKTMEAAGADFTGTFRRLTEAWTNPAGLTELRKGSGFAAWEARWRKAHEDEGTEGTEAEARMSRANPVYHPRNQRVDQALTAAEAGDYGPFETLLAVVRRPFDRQAGAEPYEEAPEQAEPFVTFCGT